MIMVSHLSKSFGKTTAVSDVNLQVQEQDILGLVGPDGAGKTTLLRMVCGLIEPDKGEVRLMGFVPKQMEKARENLGYMPQRFSLYGDLTVMENINFFAAMYKISNRTILERADEILGLTNLIDFKGRLADQLSGGMKQKLALTCALIIRPRILVLDEPTYGVDPESRKEFWKILYRLNHEGMTILVSTPYMDEAELCTRVAFINNGKVAAVDSPSALRKSFGHRVLELRAIIPDQESLLSIPGVLDFSFFGYKYHVITDDLETVQYNIKQFLLQHNVRDVAIKEISPSMEDVFINLVEKEVVN